MLTAMSISAVWSAATRTACSGIGRKISVLTLGAPPHRLGVDLLPVVERDPLADLELPGGRVDELPRLGQPGDDLEVLVAEEERVVDVQEHVVGWGLLVPLRVQCGRVHALGDHDLALGGRQSGRGKDQQSEENQCGAAAGHGEPPLRTRGGGSMCAHLLVVKVMSTGVLCTRLVQLHQRGAGRPCVLACGASRGKYETTSYMAAGAGRLWHRVCGHAFERWQPSRRISRPFSTASRGSSA